MGVLEAGMIQEIVVTECLVLCKLAIFQSVVLYNTHFLFIILLKTSRCVLHIVKRLKLSDRIRGNQELDWSKLFMLLKTTFLPNFFYANHSIIPLARRKTPYNLSKCVFANF